MIAVTRLNHSGVVINSDLVEQIESTPDTVITMTTGQKLMVLESTDEIVERIKEFRRSIARPGPGCGGDSQRPGVTPFAG